MLRLTLVLYSMVATALAGAGVVAVLASGMAVGLGDVAPLLIAAGAGAALALPVSFLIAKRLV